MKLYKALALAGVLAVAGSASAEDYNRVAISYDNTHYGYNKDYKAEYDVDPSFSTNGFGLNFIHGFSLSNNLPMFLEVGGNVNFNFYSKTDESSIWDEPLKYKSQFQNINMQVPVNFVWRFNVVEDFTIAPYVGLNFKLNFMSRMRAYIDGDWEDKAEEDETKEWTNLFSDSKDKGVGDKDLTWNRFQMGWHVGVTFQYTQWSLGVQYGTDFISAYRHTFKAEDFDGGKDWKTAINTGNLKLSVGYTF